ncbi:MFS transporter [Hymenobacter busanensis]|uniref:MFS transporter n=1 Tax=Hymenobacter busanensis TaxID=2607656 RepID=A0A7L4ZVK0_9BACT|nr:MFS transporter [Hymenobacter busanensis]KAA9332434.1 MFS transporter [Hymenobacter busanensis]QHJ07228.1 MFS transporter [Hymenobacter busanensis]
MPSPARRLRLIYAVIFIDVVAGAAIGPIMPEYVRGLRQPQLWLSVGTGIFLGIQLFAAPLLGKLSDGYGRRPILVLSAVGTLLATLLLLPVRTALYFVNRASDGLTNGMYATVRSAITDLSPPDQVFKNLGLEGAIISFGFVLGPMCSGLLLTFYRIPEGHQATYVAGFAVALAALNIGLSLLLRETHAQRTGVTPAALRAAVREALNLPTIWRRLRAKERAHPGLLRLVITQALFTLSIGYYFYFVPFASLSALRMDARAISYFFMAFGAASVVINYLFYTYVADRLNQRRAIFWLAALGVPVLAAYGLVGASRVGLYVIVAFDCLTLSLVQGLIEGLLAQRTSDQDRGEIFGLNQAVQGFASLAGTLMFGALSVVDLRLPWAWFALCLAGVAWLVRGAR